MLGSDTSPLTMAVYGPWGRGKVSCQLRLLSCQCAASEMSPGSLLFGIVSWLIAKLLVYNWT
jgi:hypothetical protein